MANELSLVFGVGYTVSVLIPFTSFLKAGTGTEVLGEKIFSPGSSFQIADNWFGM